MYCVYILENIKDNRLYIGYTKDLKQRIKLHKEGRVKSTKHRQPIHLLYYEAYLDKADAKGREIFLKSESGHRFIKKQLFHYFQNTTKQ
jgi:putative endonuclease